jgi:hypothetical protein
MLNGLKLVAWSPVDARHTATSKTRHLVAGEVLGPSQALAICYDPDTAAYFLFRCDDAWAVLADTWHQSLDEARAQGEFEYAGVNSTWQDVT